MFQFRSLIDCCEDRAIQLDEGPLPGEEPSPGRIDAMGAELRPAEVPFDYYVNVLMFSELPVPFSAPRCFPAKYRWMQRLKIARCYVYRSPVLRYPTFTLLGINCCFISQSARRHRQEKSGSAAAASATRSRFLPFEVRNRFDTSLAERHFYAFDGTPDKQAHAQRKKKGCFSN